MRRQRLEQLLARLRSLDLRLRIAAARRRLETADAAVLQLVRLRLTRGYARLDPLIAHLTQLSPLKILERGYALVTDATGRIVKEPADAPVGSEIAVRLARGQIAAQVIKR
jgi:exodeoxyribonuclease VII large subunit